jgi:hypothetical protein
MRIGVTVRRTAVATIAAVALAFAVASVPIHSVKDGAVVWARGLTEAQRVQFATPERLQSLPFAYRVALLGAMETPEHQADLWKGVFHQYRRTHVHLTTEQAKILATAETLVSPAVFARKQSTQLAKQLEAARLGVRASLGDAAALYLYKLHGPEAPGEGLPGWERVLLYGRRNLPNATSTVSAEESSCDCTDDSDCYSHTTCKGTDCSAYDSWWGCGPEHHCTKICNYDEEL